MSHFILRTFVHSCVAEPVVNVFYRLNTNADRKGLLNVSYRVTKYLYSFLCPPQWRGIMMYLPVSVSPSVRTISDR